MNWKWWMLHVWLCMIVMTKKKYSSAIWYKLLRKVPEEHILWGSNCVLITKKQFLTALTFSFTLSFISKEQLCSARLIFAIHLFELQKLLFHLKPFLAWDSFCHPAGFHNAAVVFVLLLLFLYNATVLFRRETAYSAVRQLPWLFFLYSFFHILYCEEHLRTLALCLVLGWLWNIHSIHT